MEKERGYTVCRNGRLKKGIEVKGDAHSVSIPTKCPSGSKPVALFHTHPGPPPFGSLTPSPLDIKTMHEKGLPICIKAGNKIKCYRPKKRP